MKNKDFDCVKMVRDIRDQIYEDYKKKGKSLSVMTLSQDVRNTDLWKRLNKQ